VQQALDLLLGTGFLHHNGIDNVTIWSDGYSSISFLPYASLIRSRY
jgi:hypothetical protein